MLGGIHHLLSDFGIGSPLRVVRELGRCCRVAARSQSHVVGIRFTGLKAWWVQRVSAVYMLLFILFLLYSFALHPLHDFSQWHPWVAQPGASVAFLFFFAALLGHMCVGLRDVLLDYAKPVGLRRCLLTAVALGLLGLGIWLLCIPLRLPG